MDHSNIKSLLDSVVEQEDRGLYIYPPGTLSECSFLSYRELRDAAIRNAYRLRCLSDYKPHGIYLLHFDKHEDSIIWFWSVIYANGIPAISTPFTKNVDGRFAHIQHLYSLLEDPVCLTRKCIIPRDFLGERCLKLACVDDLEYPEAHDDYRNGIQEPEIEALRSDGLTLLMLTSGSTGNAKAVCFSHSNLISSVKGKTALLQTPADTTYFNFIGMDHVAALVETHLRSLYVGISQVHVQASDLIPDPLQFLRLAEKHRVSQMMAPNFFLARLRDAIEVAMPLDDKPDLSCLTWIISGGEANPVETANALSRLLHRFGAPRNCITTGWGMTETCAGSIYNTRFPDYDLEMGYEIASVGKCILGMETRVSPLAEEAYDGPKDVTAHQKLENGPPTNSNGINRVDGTHGMNGHSKLANGTANGCSSTNQVHSEFSVSPSGSQKVVEDLASVPRADFIGNLEVRGDVVFKRYFNNAAATQSSFTEDGWFKTGDLAFVDNAGHLNMVGRIKDTMTINGVKYLPHEVESAIDMAGIPGVEPSFTACFSRRSEGAQTEHICILYLPTYAPEDVQARMRALDGITKIVALQTSSKPHVLPLDESCLQKTTLGKLQRAKLKASFEKGDFARLQEIDEAAVTAFRERHFTAPASETEERMLRVFQDVLGLKDGMLGVETPYFEAGLTSIDLIKIRRKLEIAFELSQEIPLITMINQSTVRALSNAVTSLSLAKVEPYNPVVTLSSKGSKTPLFLIHPGVGEILVFFGLVKFLDDRPVHAMRARGFNAGEPFFTSIGEVIDTYYAAIRETQPNGPYALAGYSWGSMVAFELSKKFEADGETVGFLGAFNLPPHIKWRMRELDWVECLVHLAYFSGLISEDSTAQVTSHIRTLLSKQAQLDYLISISDPDRFKELGLTSVSLENWADVGYSLQSTAVDYEPTGRVSRMDVFYCDPLTALGLTKQQWKEEKLGAWQDYVDDVQYHEVDGAHYTMLLPEHVGTFQRTLKAVMKVRGV